MAEIAGYDHLHHLLLLLHQISSGSYAEPPVRRGPMYSAYAELRAQKLRRRRAPPAMAAGDPVFATPKKKTAASPLRTSMPVFSIGGSRKENRKPVGASSMTPPPPSPAAHKAAANRLGSVSAYKTQDKKRFGAAVAATTRDGRAIAMRKSYACLKEIKDFSAVALETGSRRTKNIW